MTPSDLVWRVGSILLLVRRPMSRQRTEKEFLHLKLLQRSLCERLPCSVASTDQAPTPSCVAPKHHPAGHALPRRARTLQTTQGSSSNHRPVKRSARCLHCLLSLKRGHRALPGMTAPSESVSQARSFGGPLPLLNRCRVPYPRLSTCPSSSTPPPRWSRRSHTPRGLATEGIPRSDLPHVPLAAAPPPSHSFLRKAPRSSATFAAANVSPPRPRLPT